MLTAEDCALLGLELERHPRRRASSVSQILRAIREDMERGTATWELEGVAGTGRQDGFRILVAADQATRARAYALARRVYEACGYVGEDERGLCVSNHDAAPQTLTLLAEDAHGREAGTVSLLFDSPAGLPCDELYGTELAPLRAQGRRLVEATRLALAPEYTHSKALLVHLFNFISVYARRVEQATDFMIEVNPRHVAFYLRLLLFTVQGPERACPRVNGAPAVLLRLDLAAQAEEIRRVGGTKSQARGPHGKTLYAHFQPLADEHMIAAFLAACQRPMTPEEMRLFRLDREALLAEPQVA